MDYYSSVQFIDDIDSKIRQKEGELIMMKFTNTDNIIHNTLARDLQSQIDELRIQRTYYSDFFSTSVNAELYWWLL